MRVTRNLLVRQNEVCVIANLDRPWIAFSRYICPNTRTLDMRLDAHEVLLLTVIGRLPIEHQVGSTDIGQIKWRRPTRSD